MTEKINTNKGETDVIREDATILYSPNMVDLSKANTVRGNKGEWDEFQLFGSSNANESAYQAPEDLENDQALMKRIRNRQIGRKIKQLNLQLAA